MDEKTLAQVLSENHGLRQIEPDIYSVLPTDEPSGSYDDLFGTFYDRIACSRLYNRLVWGYSTSDYHIVCRDALESSNDGWFLDAGCGSLAFTVRAYSSYFAGRLILVDRSLKLLKMAKSRLISRTGRVPDHIALLHADVLRLPFRPATFGTVISLNLLHVFDDANAAEMLLQLKNVLLPDGKILLTTLVENHRLADRYLHMWANAGELIPRNEAQVLSLLHSAGLHATHRLCGNLAFLHCA